MSEPLPEEVCTAIPGPRTIALSAELRETESRNVTYLAADFPVFWQSAHGANVVDVDGNRYIDLTGAFGVANVGHTNPAVAAAIAAQAAKLMHAMGDVHPTEIKTRLLEKLISITPDGLDKGFLASTGAEAVEAAMKTAMLATGKAAFAAFHGAYHGLSLGALEVSGIPKFREPFQRVLPNRTLFLDYAADPDSLRASLALRADLAAVIVEPIQARAGCILPPAGWLRALRAICDELQLLLIVDEIYTGFGRTGSMFACEYEGIIPDILCIGKAMANGFPISAMLARTPIMNAWPISEGEALHTSTYLGNPMACAAALATIAEIERLQLPHRASDFGAHLKSRLRAFESYSAVRAVRGRGLMWGIELGDGSIANTLVTQALRHGVIVLQAGLRGEVISITPPLVIARFQLDRALDILESLTQRLDEPPAPRRTPKT
ncbi:MAG: aspartate aminotransferase family protein [Candidatus Eremiobacteraeota bacterium]|nr:aspartate aminotransferase family protein [Candidatus Eremiobacteraeota bacterium]